MGEDVPTFIGCMRVIQLPEPQVPSVDARCHDCKVRVWRSVASFDIEATALCISCLRKRARGTSHTLKHSPGVVAEAMENGVTLDDMDKFRRLYFPDLDPEKRG